MFATVITLQKSGTNIKTIEEWHDYKDQLISKDVLDEYIFLFTDAILDKKSNGVKGSTWNAETGKSELIMFHDTLTDSRDYIQSLLGSSLFRKGEQQFAEAGWTMDITAKPVLPADIPNAQVMDLTFPTMQVYVRPERRS